MKNKSPLKPGERIRGIHFGVRGYFYARNVLVGSILLSMDALLHRVETNYLEKNLGK
jgi:hypothetical protein